MGLFDGVRRGPRTGGDAIRERVAEATDGADAFIFAYGELEIHAFFVEDPLPHVLYCTYGLSNVGSSQKIAGTQTELTMRVPDTDLPEQWPADQLARMAKRVRRTGHDIAPGHHMSTSGTVAGYVFVTDPILGILDAPTGLVRFTYAVGLLGDEYERMLCWDPVRFAGVLGDYVPLGITDPAREPITANEEARGELEEKTEAEGASISAMLARYLSVDESGRVDMDPAAAGALLRGARYRLRYGRPFALVTDAVWCMFDPGAARAEFAEDHLVVPATSALTNELLAVFDAEPGTYPLRTSPVTITVIDPEA